MEHDGAGVLFEYTGAYLLGIDGRRFLSAELSQAVATVLDRFVDADSEGVEGKYYVWTERELEGVLMSQPVRASLVRKLR